MTSALIGASRPEQIDENLAALDAPALTAEELTRIDEAVDGVDVGLKAWQESANR